MSADDLHITPEALPPDKKGTDVQKSYAGLWTFVRAKGTCYFDSNDQQFFDAASPSWISLLGHSHPSIHRAISAQAREMQGVWYPGSYHPGAEKLGDLLCKLFPANHTRVVYTDAALQALSKAIEIALLAAAPLGRKKILIFSGWSREALAYHFTLAARNAGTFSDKSLRQELLVLPMPDTDNARNVFKVFKNQMNKGDVAAFVYQPLLLGPDYRGIYNRTLLDKMLLLCRRQGTLAVADESYTGFGRTGDFFASGGQQFFPDIACMEPGAGAQLPLAAVTCTQAVFDSCEQAQGGTSVFLKNESPANPLACAAALAAIDELQEESLQASMRQVARMQYAFAKKLQEHPTVLRVRTLGTYMMIECNNQQPENNRSLSAAGIREYFVEKGILLTSDENILILSLPYVSSPQWVKKIHMEIKGFLDLNRQINLF